MNPELKPGDTVVALSELCRTCAIICGVFAGPICVWIAAHKFLYAFVGLLFGGLIGFLIGHVLGPLLFPSSPGNVFVVKAGSGALILALKACLTSGILTALTIGVFSSIFLHGPWTQTLMTGLGVAIVLGFISACLASFL